MRQYPSLRSFAYQVQNVHIRQDTNQLHNRTMMLFCLIVLVLAFIVGVGVIPRKYPRRPDRKRTFTSVGLSYGTISSHLLPGSSIPLNVLPPYDNPTLNILSCTVDMRTIVDLPCDMTFKIRWMATQAFMIMSPICPNVLASAHAA
ncbi:hypothetical protein C8J57DRAFT_1511121 [Mycena rebaudengoi]|nr:hypothetical protein C8J57DRAFT_1511121 [Mycena rebaudengoi]